MIIDGIKAIQYTVCQIRTGTMSCHAVQLDRKSVSTGEHGARFSRNRACRHIPLYMSRHTGIHRDFRFLYNVRKQIFYITAAFLTALKAEYHIAVQLVPVLVKDLCLSQQHRRMGIVSTCVRYAVIFGYAYLLACQIARILRNWECVHIRTQQNGLSRTSAIDSGDDSAVRNLLILDPDCIQLSGNILQCLIFLTGDLRILMQMPSEPYHIVKALFCLI